MTAAGQVARLTVPVAVAIDIRDVREDIVAAVDADAEATNTSMNEKLVQILCERYGVPYTQGDYPYTAGAASTHWNLRIPERLRKTLKAHAQATGNTMTGCVLLTVAHHYGLSAVSARKRVEPVLDPGKVAEARARNDNGRGESLRKLASEYGVTRKALTRAIRE